jgi:hypothetical protein
MKVAMLRENHHDMAQTHHPPLNRFPHWLTKHRNDLGSRLLPPFSRGELISLQKVQVHPSQGYLVLGLVLLASHILSDGRVVENKGLVGVYGTKDGVEPLWQ